MYLLDIRQEQPRFSSDSRDVGPPRLLSPPLQERLDLWGSASSEVAWYWVHLLVVSSEEAHVTFIEEAGAATKLGDQGECRGGRQKLWSTPATPMIDFVGAIGNEVLDSVGRRS